MARACHHRDTLKSNFLWILEMGHGIYVRGVFNDKSTRPYSIDESILLIPQKNNLITIQDVQLQSSKRDVRYLETFTAQRMIGSVMGRTFQLKYGSNQNWKENRAKSRLKMRLPRQEAIQTLD
ncbi:hypothetical protein SCA6_002294 [Theobroma cacao]